MCGSNPINSSKLDWRFDAWPAIEPNWNEAARGDNPYDQTEFHVDLGCGTIKKGRIGIDRYPAPGVNVLMDLNSGRVAAVAPEPGRDAAEVTPDGLVLHTPDVGRGRLLYPSPVNFEQNSYRRRQGCAELVTIADGLPFEDSSIKSIITHHCLEHIGDGFVALMHDIYRVLEPGGLLRVIVPLFPSNSAVADPDHCRYFMENSWEPFCHTPGVPHWMGSFSVPYAQTCFRLVDKDITPPTPPDKHWTCDDAREMRVALVATK